MTSAAAIGGALGGASLIGSALNAYGQYKSNKQAQKRWKEMFPEIKETGLGLKNQLGVLRNVYNPIYGQRYLSAGQRLMNQPDWGNFKELAQNLMNQSPERSALLQRYSGELLKGAFEPSSDALWNLYKTRAGQGTREAMAARGLGTSPISAQIEANTMGQLALQRADTDWQRRMQALAGAGSAEETAQGLLTRGLMGGLGAQGNYESMLADRFLRSLQGEQGVLGLRRGAIDPYMQYIGTAAGNAPNITSPWQTFGTGLSNISQDALGSYLMYKALK